MEMIIKINMDNSAFEENASYELITVLETVRFRLEQQAIIELQDAPLYDSNGNKVGSIKLKK